MTDAAPAAGLTDVWNLFVAVVGRQPIQLQVLAALGAALALLMIVDGIRANVSRKKPGSLYIVRQAHGGVRGPQSYVAKNAKAAVTMARPLKKIVQKRSPHKAPRPGINRVPLDMSGGYEVYQPLEVEAPRETDISLL